MKFMPIFVYAMALFFSNTYAATILHSQSSQTARCCEKESGATLSSENVIYLISSSSTYDEKYIPEIKQAFSSIGYSVDTTYLHQNPTPLGYVDTDDARAKMLIKALTDNKVKYLWFVRGGAGALNLYSYLKAKKVKIAASTPKILFGFSDVTAIHDFVNNELKWPSVHGVLASYNMEMHAIDNEKKTSMYNSLKDTIAITEKGSTYSGILPMNAAAYYGVTGIAGGGNLTLVQSFFSTEYEESYSKKVLLLEDVGATQRQLDRTLHQLLYKENFHPKAIIFGQFYSDDANDKDKALYKEVVGDFANKVSYPVYYYPEFGHGYTNMPFILSQKITLNCDMKYTYCSLKQPPLKNIKMR